MYFKIFNKSYYWQRTEAEGFACSTSDIGEGVLDLVSSATGKHVCTPNRNFVRDNICEVNESTYNVVKSVTSLGSIAVSGS